MKLNNIGVLFIYWKYNSYTLYITIHINYNTFNKNNMLHWLYLLKWKYKPILV